MIGCHHRHRSKNNNKICNKKQAHEAIKESPICLTYYDHDLYSTRSNLDTQWNIREKQVLMIIVNK